MRKRTDHQRRIDLRRLPLAVLYVLLYPIIAIMKYFKNRKDRNKPDKRPLRIVGRVFYTALIQIICLALVSIILIYHGPFVKLRNSIVFMAMNTNSQKYLATWFLSTQEINSIMDKANPQLINADQSINAIQVNTTPIPSEPISSSNPSPAPGQTVSPADLQGVTITDVTGNGYHGKLMTISDPSRVTLGLSPSLGQSGSRLSQIVAADGAIGGVNAGGFLDDNFIQNGALPSGIVIVDGVIKSQQSGLSSFDVIGLNKDNVLVIANSMTLDQIQQSNLRCAVSFGPALVINGESLVVSGGAGLEPRTAIGQRQDGTILLLVIDGRQSSSRGVTYKTLADLMLQYGAYNAANLDGGSSTTMYWNSQIVNSPCDILGERSIPTAFVVMPKN